MGWIQSDRVAGVFFLEMVVVFCDLGLLGIHVCEQYFMYDSINVEVRFDYKVVRQYFEFIGIGFVVSVSYMAYEQNLLEDVVRYRFRNEFVTVGDWLDSALLVGSVLDVGCGAGVWIEIFVQRFVSVVGVE